jgi:hypothetical protein
MSLVNLNSFIYMLKLVKIKTDVPLTDVVFEARTGRTFFILVENFSKEVCE